MAEFIELLANLFWGIFDVLNGCVMEFNGYVVNLASLLLAFMIAGFVISAFWKGAKT